MPIVVCHKDFLVKRCEQRGVPLAEAMKSVVSRDGDIVSVDTSHPSYPSRALGDAARQPTQRGPGTELKKLLSSIGITAKPTCSCNARARLMDERGIEWCEQNIDEIVGWLREEASKRGLPFVDMAGRVLVKRAIRNAKKATLE